MLQAVCACAECASSARGVLHLVPCPCAGVRLFRALAAQQAQGDVGGPAPPSLEYPKLPPSLAPSGSLGAQAASQPHRAGAGGDDGDSPGAAPAATTFSTGRKRRASTRRLL